MFEHYRKRFKVVLDGVEKSLGDAINVAPSSHRELLFKGLGLGDYSPTVHSSKRLRGAIAALIHGSSSCENENCCWVPAIPELIHAASLIVDDLQDGHRTRWNRPSLWVNENPPLAMNTAIMMLALAQTLSQRFGGEMGQDLVATLTEMLEGQVHDLRAAETYELGLSAYLRIAEGKTGALLAFAAKIGGHALCLRTQQQLSAWAMATGVAHQLQDDVDDIRFGVESEIPESNIYWFIGTKEESLCVERRIETIGSLAKKFADEGESELVDADISMGLRADLLFISECIGKRDISCVSPLI